MYLKRNITSFLRVILGLEYHAPCTLLISTQLGKAVTQLSTCKQL